MRKIIVCILSILLLLAVVSAQDSATGATSAGDGCQSDEEVTKKVDECKESDGEHKKEMDSAGCTIVICEYPSTGVEDTINGNSAGTSADSTTDGSSTGTSAAGNGCPLTDDEINKKMDECKGVAKKVMDSTGCTTVECDETAEGDGCPSEGEITEKVEECEKMGWTAEKTKDSAGCDEVACKEPSTGTTASSTTDTTTNDPTTSADSNTCPDQDELDQHTLDCEAKGATAVKVENLYGCTVIDCQGDESTGTDSTASGTSTDSTSTDTEDDSTDDTTTESTDCDEDIDDGKFEECTNNGMYAVTDIDPVSGCKIVICKESLTDDTSGTDTTYDCPSEEEISSVKESCEEKEYQYVEGVDDKGCKFGMCKEPETGEIGEVTEFETTCTISKDKECIKITCNEVGFTHVSCKDEEPMDSAGPTDVPYEDKKPATKIGEWIKGFFKSDDKGAGDVMGLEEESATTAG